VVRRRGTRPVNLPAAGHSDLSMDVSRRRYLGLAGTLGAAALAGCPGEGEPADDWRQFRANPRRTGHNPVGGGPESGGTVGWSRRIAQQALSGPVVADEVVYFNGAAVSAVGAGDGSRSWRAQLPFPSGITPVVGSDAVYAVSRHSAFAIDRAGGENRWTYTFGRRVANAPGFDGERVYVGFRTASDPYEAMLVALDPETGEREWRAPIGRDNVLLFTPAVEDDLVAVGKEAVFAVDAADGTERWTFDVPDARFGTPVLAGDAVYVGATTPDREGLVFGLDAADGTERWRVETGLGARSVAFDGDHVYATSDRVYALDPVDGSVAWRFDSDSFVHSPPSVAGDTVYLGGLLGDVVALSAAEGTERWRLETDGTFLSPPSIVGESAYVAGRNGVAYRVDAG